MKTVAEISKELGISVQAVHKRIKKILSNSEQKKIFSLCIQKDMNGKLYLNEDGEFILKSTYQPDTSTISTDNLNQFKGLNQLLKPDENIHNKTIKDDMVEDKIKPSNDLNQPASTINLNQIDKTNKNKKKVVYNGLRFKTKTKINNQKKNITSGLNSLNDMVEVVDGSQTGLNINDFLKKIEEQKNEIKRLNNELSKEREHSREQANRILSLAEQMTELTRNNQILLKQEQDKNAKILLLEEKNIEKSHSGFLSKLFKKNDKANKEN